MNLILPKISNTFTENTTSVNNIGYSFNKNTLGRNPGHSSLNNNATTIVSSYFASLTNNYSNLKNSNDVNIVTKAGKNGAFASVSNVNKQYLISKPTFSHTNNKVTIQLFYYVSSEAGANSATTYNDQEIFKKNLSGLSITLAQLFQKKVNLVAIRLYYPYLNSHILSKYLAHNAVSNTFMDFQESILTNPSLHKTNLPAHISGIKVQVSGRLVTETVVPRITVKSCLIGSFNGANNPTGTTQFIDYSKFTTKNELGAFTVKVWICQRSYI